MSLPVGSSLTGGLSWFRPGSGGKRSGGSGGVVQESLGPLTTSGAESELVLLNGLFYPGPQTGLVEGLDERLFGRVVLCGRLLGFMVGARLEHLDPQDGRQLKGERKRHKCEQCRPKMNEPSFQNRGTVWQSGYGWSTQDCRA